jgi:hypothetical protein
MKRREYLGMVSAGAVAGTAGCFWEDGDSKTRLAHLAVANYHNRPQRFVVHVEKDGEDALTTAFELEGGGNYPEPRKIDCEWSTEPGEFTVQILQVTEPTDTLEVAIPDEYPREDAAGDCVGLDFFAGQGSGSDQVTALASPCEEFADHVEFCVPDAR